jgi:hypothetical protein
MTGEDSLGDVGDRFGATVDVARPPPDDAGFFLVKRHPEADHEAFRTWLLSAVGGVDRLLLGHPDGLFVVHTTFGRAETLRGEPHVSHVGGVNVDIERLRQALTPPE